MSAENFSRKLPETAFKLHTSSGSLDCAVACAPAALEMTEVEIAEIAVIAESGKNSPLITLRALIHK